VALAPNDAVLVEIPLAAQDTSNAPANATAPADVSQLPVTGGDATLLGASLLGLAGLLALALLRRGRLRSCS
jgi:hypothetical protein